MSPSNPKNHRLTLLVDAGNSSLKWALMAYRSFDAGPSSSQISTVTDHLLHDIAQAPVQRIDNQDVTADQLLLQWRSTIQAKLSLLQLQADDVPLRDLMLSWVCVGPDAVRKSVMDAFFQLTGQKATGPYRPQAFVASYLAQQAEHQQQAMLSALRNNYLDPAQLGADRWVAAFGFAALGLGQSGQRYLLVSAGTATTIDLIHCNTPREISFEGGWILPGAALMHRSLVNHTQDLGYAWQEESPDADQVPKASADAMAQGVAMAQTAGLSTLIRRYGVSRVWLHGGQASFWKKAAIQWHGNDCDISDLPGLTFAGLAACALGKQSERE